MKRYIVTFMTALIAVVNVKADYVRIYNQEMVLNQSSLVTVWLFGSEKNYVSFQMDLTLPEGIIINKEETKLGSCIIDEEQELIIGKIGDNTYRITSTSFSLTPMKTSGDIINLSLTATGNTTGGVATMSNIRFVTNDSKRVKMDNVDFNITVVRIIEFADATVKSICVNNWDKNGDGEFDTGEAASIYSLNKYFKGKQITSFNEFQYFRLMSIGSDAFSGCSKMTSIIIPNSVQYIYDQAFRNCTGLTSLVIPNGVTTISKSAFYGCSGLTSLEIPNSVTTIGEYAFEGCSSLTTLNIPNSITTIEARTFGFCEHLTSVIIPNSVTTIGSGAFYNCYNLPSVDIPSSVTSIGASAFGNCDKLTSLTVNWSVPISVDTDIFSDCSNVTLHVPVGSKAAYLEADYWKDFKEIVDGTEEPSIIVDGFEYLIISDHEKTTKVVGGPSEGDIEIPSSFVYNEETYSVKAIDGRAFYGYSEMNSITIPNSVASIGNSAFANCISLTSVTVNWEEPIIINTSPFESPDNIVLYVPVGCKSAYESANYWNSFKDIREINPSGSSVISFADSNVKSLCVANWDTDGDGELSKVEAEAVLDLGKVFSGNKSITSFDELQYFTGLMIIGENSFSNCTALTSVTIPNSVTSIDGFAFSRCSSLTSIAISNGVTSLGDGAFYGCIGLTSITIPNGVTYIGDAAFWDCVGLTSITIPNSVSYIGGFAFEWCGRLTSIIIPNSVTSIGYGAFAGCTGLTSMTVESGNPNYDSRNDCNAIIETSTNTLILGCKSTIIPNSVTSIGDGAFYGCSVLTSITIPNSVTSIGEGAFDSCSGLTSIIIPNNVTSIGEYAFSRCSSLTSITIPNSVTTIGDGAFQNCNSLTSVTTYNSVPLSLQSNEIFGNSSNATLIVPKGSKSAYESAMYWKDFKDIREFSENGFIISANDIFRGANLWAGYVSQEDLALPDELEAYIITDLGTTTATAYPIDYIPESEPVLLKREDTTIGSFEMLPGTGTAPTMNLLKTYSTDKIVSNREGFVLYNDEFVLVNEGTLPAGCVFLPANSTVVALTRSIIINGDDATEIENTKVDNDVPKDQWYDFQGRKLERKPAKNGIYILNGSKVVVKY